jgi:hypothetical protein
MLPMVPIDKLMTVTAMMMPAKAMLFGLFTVERPLCYFLAVFLCYYCVCSLPFTNSWNRKVGFRLHMLLRILWQAAGLGLHRVCFGRRLSCLAQTYQVTPLNGKVVFESSF